MVEDKRSERGVKGILFGESQTMLVLQTKGVGTRSSGQDAVSQLGTNTKAIVTESIASYLCHQLQLNVSFIQLTITQA